MPIDNTPTLTKFTVPGKIKKVSGFQVISPINSGLRFVLNFVGPDGKYTHPLDQMISKVWTKPKADYVNWYGSRQKFSMGEIKETPVSSDIWVIHMLVRDKEGAIDLKALDAAVKKLVSFAKYEKASLHISDFLIKEAPFMQELTEKVIAVEGLHSYIYETPEVLLPAKPKKSKKITKT